jgi:hypothetical protein
MSMTVIPGASIAVPVMGRDLSAAAMTRDRALVQALHGAIDPLVRAASDYRAYPLPQADGTP